MKNLFSTGALAAASLFALASCSTQEEMAPKPSTRAGACGKSRSQSSAAKAEAKLRREKAAEKAKATKLAGDVGLLDTEKNYMILVTKEGKLVTLDYDAKFQPTQKDFEPLR